MDLGCQIARGELVGSNPGFGQRAADRTPHSQVDPQCDESGRAQVERGDTAPGGAGKGFMPEPIDQQHTEAGNYDRCAGEAG